MTEVNINSILSDYVIPQLINEYINKNKIIGFNNNFLPIIDVTDYFENTSFACVDLEYKVEGILNYTKNIDFKKYLEKGLFPVVAYIPKGSITYTDSKHWVVRSVSLNIAEKERKIFLIKCKLIKYELDTNIGMYAVIFECKKRPLFRCVVVKYVFNFNGRKSYGSFILKNMHIVLLDDVNSQIDYEILTFIRYIGIIRRLLSRCYKKGKFTLSDEQKIVIKKPRYEISVSFVKL